MIPNKFKNTRVVIFEEDYYSGAQKDLLKKEKAVEPIYKKGSKHYIHFKTVEQLKEKGAKMKVKEFDYTAYVNKSKKQLAENKKAA